VLLAIVVGELSVDDAPLEEPELDAVVPVLDELPEPVEGAAAVVAGLSTPLLSAAAGYCGVAPGTLCDWVVVDCAYGAEHHTAAIIALTAKSFERLFIGDLHTLRGFRKGSRSTCNSTSASPYGLATAA